MPSLAPQVETAVVSIFGSCVTRDAFDRTVSDLSVHAYIARTALGSAFEEIPFPHVLDGLDPDQIIRSPFQRRMIEIDFSKSAAEVLASAREQTDCYVIDLIDERFQIVEVDGALATASAELDRCGALQRLGGALVPWDSELHFEGFRRGFARLMCLLETTKRPIILNKVFWAKDCSDGTSFSSSWIAKNNDQLARRYDVISNEYELKTIEYPASLLVALVGHRWAKAPYHFVNDMYEHQRREIRRYLFRGDSIAET